MYNDKTKSAFIKSYTNNLNTAETCEIMFNSLEKYEAKHNADICTFKKEDLVETIGSIVGLRTKTKDSRLAILRQYARWCMSNGIPGACDEMLKFQPDMSMKVKQYMVANPTHLQKYLDEICEPESEKTTDNIYRCFYWMAYSGMAEEDIIRVRVSDVDYSRMVIRFENHEYDMYKESLPAFHNATDLDSFVYKHPNYPPDKIVIRPRAEGDTVIRGLRSLPTVMSLRTELSRRSKKHLENGTTEMQLSYNRVRLSGLFYRMLEMERAGMPVDFAAEVNRITAGKVYKLDSGRNTQEAKRRQLVSDYEEDYEKWKMAFSN